MAYDYFCADWDGLCDHLIDVPWEDIFQLGAYATASEFCEWVQVGIDVYIPHRKYQVKPQSSPWFSAACAAAIVHRNHFFCLYQQNKSSESKVQFRQANNRCKRVLEAAKRVYHFPETWLSGIVPVFPSRTNLKLHNISITPKTVKKIITNLDSSKASGPDCIPVVNLKNFVPELSYILAKLFIMCLKESCFPDCWKVSLVVPVFKMVGERSTAKNYRPVSLLSVVSKVFEKLVITRLVDHLENCGLFSD